MSAVRRTFGLLRPWWWHLVGCAVLLLATTSATLAGPWILRHAIDHGLTGPGAPDLGVVQRSALLYLGIAVSALVLTHVQTVLVGRVGQGFVRSLRERVVAHVLSLPSRFFDRTASGEVLSRMTSDVDALQLLVELGAVQLAQSLLVLALLATALGLLSWELMLACLVLAPPVVIATVWFRRSSRRAYLALRERVAETVATLVEGVNGVREIQAMRQEERMLAAFDERNQRQYDANVRSVRVQALYLPVMEILPVATSCIALGLGGWLVVEDRLTVGTLTAFLLYLQLTFEPIQSLSFLFNQAQSAGAALRKEYALLDIHDVPRPGPNTLPVTGAVQLRGVGFRYDDGPPVLRRVDLTIEPGENLALVGPTGAGKTTLANLIARTLDPTEGTVTYAGVDLRGVPAPGVRERVAMVTQEGHLFAGTVRDNIRMPRPGASDDEVRDAVARIGAERIFAALPRGLETSAGHGGGLLSAGQRQLVALARAALVDASVMVLDEATSDLDPGTELAATTAMAELMRDRTVVVIAHRLSTVLDADRIAVVADGGIAEVGSHRELLARGGRYAALHEAWRRGAVPV